jgi:hypothetical protein
LQNRSYTRDLYPCYRAFARQYSKEEREMRRAVEYALDPSPDPEEVRTFLSDLGG